MHLLQDQINRTVIDGIKSIENEMLEVEKTFPNLYFENPFIKGEINVCAVYDEEKLIHNPDEQARKEYKKTFVQDVYEIKIDLLNYKVYETGNKIKKIPNNHINSDGSCCLGLFGDATLSTSDFIKLHVLPFFVWQNYKSQYGKSPPWGEYSHGEAGVKEFDKDIKNIGRNDMCYCGNGKKYKKCCLNK